MWHSQELPAVTHEMGMCLLRVYLNTQSHCKTAQREKLFLFHRDIKISKISYMQVRSNPTTA